MTSTMIVVGVDGSRRSDAAVAWAADEAVARGGHLRVVHAIDTAGMNLWMTTRPLREGLRELATPIVHRAVRIARERQPGLSVMGRALIGSPTRVLMVMSTRADLIVVGRDGRGALERLWLGNVAERLLAHASCPVIAVGESHGVPAPHIGRLVVGCGGDAVDAYTLGWAFQLAAQRNLPLLAAHAVHQPAGLVLPTGHAPTYDEAVVEAEHYLDKQLIEWTNHYPAVSATRMARSGRPAEVLTAACRPGDLLVLGHHRRAPFAYRQLGWHAAGVVRAATTAVAVVHPGGDHGAPAD